MEEHRTYYLTQMNNASSVDVVIEAANASDILPNATTTSIPFLNEPLLSTETCAYIHGGILATLFIIAMSR